MTNSEKANPKKTNLRKTNLRKATTAVRACLLAACLLLVAGPVPARAAPLPGPSAGDWLYVTVTSGGVLSGDIRGTVLLCDPPQGHGQAARACGELRTARGEVDRIPLRDAHCPMIHAPVSASARGRWEGRTVTYEETFANSCVLAARTGAVFALSP